MLGFLGGLSTALGLGFFYFIAAIPGGTAAGLPVWLAALTAWLGYTAGAAVVVAAGAPLREWLMRKLKISGERDPSKMIWKIWDRAGLAGLGLIAPVTIGPQAGALLAMSLGSPAVRVLAALSLGVVPWCVGFAVVTALGARAVS